jgi:hypothetical protein
VPDGELSNFLEDEEVMYIEDGFYFVEKLGCPMPSEIMKPCPKTDGDEPSTWIDTIIRWIDGVVTLDAFHGSRGNHMKFDSESKSWSKVSVPINDMKFFHEKSADNDNESKENGIPKEEQHVYHDVEEQDEVDEEEVGNDVDMEDDESDFEGEAMEVEAFDIAGFPRFQSVDSAIVSDVESEVDEDDFFTSVETMNSHLSDTENRSKKTLDNDEESKADDYSWHETDEANDDAFANVSRSAIIPYQPSFLGSKPPGPGPRGSNFAYSTASILMNDLSHLGVTHTGGKL